MSQANTLLLGDRVVKRIGYGAMQLAGKGVFGPPKDRVGAMTLLKQAVASGVNHIDTSDFYGPHVVNHLIRESLYPYPTDLVIVTKVGATRGADASWIPALEPEEIKRSVHDNLHNLWLDVLEVVNIRFTGSIHAPTEGSIEKQVTALAELRNQGLVRRIGLSNVTAKQFEEAQRITPIVCVQNEYNVVQRRDDSFIDDLARQHVAYVPFFPLGGFTPLQSAELSDIAASVGATPMQVALAWLLKRAPNILLIPGTSSVEHLRENLAAKALDLPDSAMVKLSAISGGQA